MKRKQRNEEEIEKLEKKDNIAELVEEVNNYNKLNTTNSDQYLESVIIGNETFTEKEKEDLKFIFDLQSIK